MARLDIGEKNGLAVWTPLKGDETIMAKFTQLVDAELRVARMSGHGKMNSAHEGYAVILEELDEFWDEVRRKREDRSPSEMLKELVQVAAMAARTAEDLDLVNGYEWVILDRVEDAERR